MSQGHGWHGYRFHELAQVPKTERADRTALLTASLTGAHATLLAATEPGAGLLTAWVRPPKERRLRFLVAGRPGFPPAGELPPSDGVDVVDGVERGVLFPSGAVARDVSVGNAAELLDRFRYWVACSGTPDALWAPTEGKTEQPRRGSFDQQAAHLRSAFAWLVLAEPLAPQALAPELSRLVNEILPLSRQEVGEGNRIALERKRSRHRELSRAQEGGAWRIRVVVGGRVPGDALTAASMLCAAGELDELPYVLAPVGRPTSFSSAAESSFVADTRLLTALTRPPEHELPGLRVVEAHHFDVTQEPGQQLGGPGLRLGDVLDEALAPAGDLVLERDTLNRHTFVCGATGGGKSQTVRHLLTEASRAGLPWLVIEPAKAEYARMATRLTGPGQDVVVIRPGDVKTPPAGFNPLEPAPGFSLQTHVDLLRALFLAAFESFEPFPQVLATALTRCYEELSWDLTLSEPVGDIAEPRYPTLGDLQRVAAQVVGEIGYGHQVAADVHGFIKVRLSSLRLGTTGRFFEGGHPLNFELLRERNVVFEIEDVGDDADKAFLMGAVLMRLSEHLRVEARAGIVHDGLRHLTVIEEAHRLLRRPEPGTQGPAAHAVEMFAALLAEVRAYGEGLVIAEQIPGKLVPDVIKNTAIKIVHRLPAEDDRDSVGAAMNLDDEQSRYVVALKPGDAAVFGDGMDRPLLVRMPDGTDIEKHGDRTTAPVTPLIGRRSDTCGAECGVRPCTLRSIRRARHLLDGQPWLTVWAEMTVLAHLTGHEPLRPLPAQLRGIEPHLVSPRELDCALSHAVDDAVAVRSALLQTTVGHVDLAQHCIGAMRATIAGQPFCAKVELDYLAAVYRWAHLKRILTTERLNGTVHPDTPALERRFGRAIPGRTREEQLAAVDSWFAESFADQATRDAVTYGTASPSVLRTALGDPGGVDGWQLRLANALGPFEVVDWPLTHLVHDTAGK